MAQKTALDFVQLETSMKPTEAEMRKAREILKNRSFSDDDYDEMQREQAVIDVAQALADHRAETIEECAKVAEVTRFIRICEPHEPVEVEVKITHHGSIEIATAIRSLKDKK